MELCILSIIIISKQTCNKGNKPCLQGIQRDEVKCATWAKKIFKECSVSWGIRPHRVHLPIRGGHRDRFQYLMRLHENNVPCRGLEDSQQCHIMQAFPPTVRPHSSSEQILLFCAHCRASLRHTCPLPNVQWPIGDAESECRQWAEQWSIRPHCPVVVPWPQYVWRTLMAATSTWFYVCCE